jgi:hypothetical protein
LNPASHAVSAQHLQVLLADAALQLQEVSPPHFTLFESFLLKYQRCNHNTSPPKQTPAPCDSTLLPKPNSFPLRFQAHEDNALLEGIVHSRYQLAPGSSSSGLFSGDGLAMMHAPPCISQVVAEDPVVLAAMQQAEM